MIAVVKYNAGNLYSVVHALRRLGAEPVITDDPALLRGADKVLFPGVGEASTTMRHLRERGLDEVIRSLTQPVLGICLGMQLLCARSEEGGDTSCLGVFGAEVKRFRPDGEHKIPHMGWNQVHDLRSPLFGSVSENDFVYFVHSYYVPVCPETIAVTDYTLPFSAAIRKDNFYATQFHPEKSGRVGENILRQFLRL